MFYYEGLSCPVCSKAFTAEDDVVVCPQCGLPHHRACWKSIGKCFEESHHGTPQQWSRERSHATSTTPPPTGPVGTAAQVCPRCGTQNTEYAEFCNRCGQPLEAKDWHSAPPQYTPFAGEYTPYGQPCESYSSEERIGDSNAADLAAMVGNNAGYYVERFRRIGRGDGGGWNWLAFLLGPIWLFYRKQYALGSVYLLLHLMANIASTVVYTPIDANNMTEQLLIDMMSNPMFLLAVVLSYIVMALRILLGIRANHFYFRHCEKKIADAKSNQLSVAESASMGGVSVGAAVCVAILMYTVVPIILEVFIGLL